MATVKSEQNIVVATTYESLQPCSSNCNLNPTVTASANSTLRLNKNNVSFTSASGNTILIPMTNPTWPVSTVSSLSTNSAQSITVPATSADQKLSSPQNVANALSVCSEILNYTGGSLPQKFHIPVAYRTSSSSPATTKYLPAVVVERVASVKLNATGSTDVSKGVYAAPVTNGSQLQQNNATAITTRAGVPIMLRPSTVSSDPAYHHVAPTVLSKSSLPLSSSTTVSKNQLETYFAMGSNLHVDTNTTVKSICSNGPSVNNGIYANNIYTTLAPQPTISVSELQNAVSSVLSPISPPISQVINRATSFDCTRTDLPNGELIDLLINAADMIGHEHDVKPTRLITDHAIDDVGISSIGNCDQLLNVKQEPTSSPPSNVLIKMHNTAKLAFSEKLKYRIQEYLTRSSPQKKSTNFNVPVALNPVPTTTRSTNGNVSRSIEVTTGVCASSTDPLEKATFELGKALEVAHNHRVPFINKHDPIELMRVRNRELKQSLVTLCNKGIIPHLTKNVITAICTQLNAQEKDTINQLSQRQQKEPRSVTERSIKRKKPLNNNSHQNVKCSGGLKSLKCSSKPVKSVKRRRTDAVLDDYTSVVKAPRLTIVTHSPESDVKPDVTLLEASICCPLPLDEPSNYSGTCARTRGYRECDKKSGMTCARLRPYSHTNRRKICDTLLKLVDSLDDSLDYAARQRPQRPRIWRNKDRSNYKWFTPLVHNCRPVGDRFISLREHSIRRQDRNVYADCSVVRPIVLPDNELSTTSQYLWYKSYNGPPLVELASSFIHGVGVFAAQDICDGTLFLEYVGIKVRCILTDRRESSYKKRGFTSNYVNMFRLDNDYVIDATFQGGLARFINHSCNPNCSARVISHNKEKHIVLIAKKEIVKGEEICYDYKLPLEASKIPCKCQAPNCRGYLN